MNDKCDYSPKPSQINLKNKTKFIYILKFQSKYIKKNRKKKIFNKKKWDYSHEPSQINKKNDW